MFCSQLPHSTQCLVSSPNIMVAASFVETQGAVKRHGKVVQQAKPPQYTARGRLSGQGPSMALPAWRHARDERVRNTQLCSAWQRRPSRTHKGTTQSPVPLRLVAETVFTHPRQQGVVARAGAGKASREVGDICRCTWLKGGRCVGGVTVAPRSLDGIAKCECRAGSTLHARKSGKRKPALRRETLRSGHVMPAAPC